jgi:hypothetical protein
MSLALAPAAHAEWYIAKIGGETCVPLEELGTDGKYHSVNLGMIHTPEDYIHTLAGSTLELTPQPNTPSGIIDYKLGEDVHIIFFNGRDICLAAWAGVAH